MHVILEPPPASTESNQESETQANRWDREITMGSLMFYACVVLVGLIVIYLVIVCVRRMLATTPRPSVVVEIKKFRIRLQSKDKHSSEALIISNQKCDHRSDDDVILQVPA